MRPPLFPEGATATFADYFELNVAIEDILDELGVSFRLQRCELPRRDVDQDLVDELMRRFDRTLPHVDLTNEMARREFLIAPVVLAFLSAILTA